MASNADLSARAAPFLDLGTVAIDINKCVPGVHCRMLKVGGVGAIKDSIKEYGYKRVRENTIFHNPINRFTLHPALYDTITSYVLIKYHVVAILVTSYSVRLSVFSIHM